MHISVDTEFISFSEPPSLGVGDRITYRPMQHGSLHEAVIISIEGSADLEPELGAEGRAGYIGFANWEFEVLGLDDDWWDGLTADELERVEAECLKLPLPKFCLGEVVTPRSKLGLDLCASIITGISWQPFEQATHDYQSLSQGSWHYYLFILARDGIMPDAYGMVSEAELLPVQVRKLSPSERYEPGENPYNLPEGLEFAVPLQTVKLEFQLS